MSSERQEDQVKKELEKLYESPELKKLLQSDAAREIEALLETHREWGKLQDDCKERAKILEKSLKDSAMTEYKVRITRDILLLQNGMTANPEVISRLITSTLHNFSRIGDSKSVSITPWEEIPEVNREWLISDWLPADTVTMFTGQGGAGKSWLTLQVACEIASGAGTGRWCETVSHLKRSYDPNPDTNPKHIVFGTYEDEPAEIKRRLNALCSAFEWIESERNVIKEHLHIVDMRGVGSVWGPGPDKHIAITGELLKAGMDLRELCEDLGARLLILDPLSGAFGGNENDRTSVYDFVSSFRGWGDTVNCGMLVVGHLPKTQGAGFSGSTAWEASARAMWLLSIKEKLIGKGKDAEKKKYYALQHTKSNYAMRQQDIPLGKRPKTGWYFRCESIEEAIEHYDSYHKGEETIDDDDDLIGF